MKRDVRVDILRALAIVLIILAHVSPPVKIFTIRMFDVPLMAMVLGMSYGLSNKKSNRTSYLDYCIKRFKRLVVPAWIFVTVYIMLVYLLKSGQGLTGKYIFNSYMLSRFDSMPYIWIIRIFLVVSLTLPILYFVSNYYRKITWKLFLLTISFFIQRTLIIIFLKSGSNQFLENIVMYFSYSIIALVGVWLVQLKFKENICLMAFIGTVFFVFVMKKGFWSIINDKYPPGLLYTTYGLFIGVLLFILLSNAFIMKNIKFYIPKWLSKNSLQLYYVHAIIVTFISPTILGTWWVRKFIIVMGLSILIVYGFQYLSSRLKIYKQTKSQSNKKIAF